MDDRFIRERECKFLTGISRTTRWDMELTGKFPCRYPIVPGLTAYLWSEILAWMCWEDEPGPYPNIGGEEFVDEEFNEEGIDDEVLIGEEFDEEDYDAVYVDCETRH